MLTLCSGSSDTTPVDPLNTTSEHVASEVSSDSGEDLPLAVRMGGLEQVSAANRESFDTLIVRHNELAQKVKAIGASDRAIISILIRLADRQQSRIESLAARVRRLKGGSAADSEATNERPSATRRASV